jgi:hypothetical protein
VLRGTDSAVSLCRRLRFILLDRIWSTRCEHGRYEALDPSDLFDMSSAHRGHVNDDHVSFNTQTSTQVDGFRHYPYQNYPEEGEYT